MNITEFAKIAGVSKSAVSRYFNDGYISDEKRRLIQSAIDKTGYCPSIQARNVRTRITKLVGVIIPKLSSESCAREVEGISQVLSEEGYQLLLVNSANDPRKEVEYLELFRNNRVNGVIFLATVFTKLHDAVLKKMRVPVVIVGQEYRGLSCVCHNDFEASYSLTELMIKKGGKKPAFIGVTDDDKAAGLARKEGFLKALHDNDISIGKHDMQTAEFKMESGHEKAEVLLKNKTEYDFIFCATDSIAAGAEICCIEHGLKIPEDIMIAGLGDSQLCRAAAAPLSSVHFHYRTAGAEAAHMLLDSLKRNSPVPKTLTLDYDIIERRSTDK
ncbi:MAG: LacI family DNA-binding transcriptional regulator [Oscillospiraceae bacterium]